MEIEEKKSVKIDASVLEEMQDEKHRTKKDIFVLVREAWQLYKHSDSSAQSGMSMKLSKSDHELVLKLLDWWHHPHHDIDKRVRCLVEGLLDSRGKHIGKKRSKFRL